MITTTVVGQSPDSRARQDEAAAASTPTASAAGPAPGQRAYTPPPGVMISGFERQYVPQQSDITFDNLVTAANPLQHIPVVGTIYRAATGTQLKAPLQILGSMAVGAATGGPLGAFATIGLTFVQTIASLGPAVPGHVLQAADTPARSEAPMQPTGVGDGVITYADGSTGIPTWREGELTNFDMTQGNPANPDGTDSPETRRAMAMNAYNRLLQAYGGPTA